MNPLPLSELSLSAYRRVDAVCEQFEARWQEGQLGDVPEPEYAARLQHLLELELELLIRAGKRPILEEYRLRFPAHAALIDCIFRAAVLEEIADLVALRAAPPAGGPNSASLVSPDLNTITEPIPGYEILAELGRGGMGVVYQARQVKLKRLVALKMILAGTQADADDLARFRMEAEAAARLQHPNVVQIHEVGEHAGRPFLALEFLAGGNLAQKLQGNSLPAREAAEVLEKLARAMHNAHERGIVHRDLEAQQHLARR